MASWDGTPEPRDDEQVQLDELVAFERAATIPFLLLPPSELRVVREQFAIPFDAPKELIFQ